MEWSWPLELEGFVFETLSHARTLLMCLVANPYTMCDTWSLESLSTILAVVIAVFVGGWAVFWTVQFFRTIAWYATIMLVRLVLLVAHLFKLLGTVMRDIISTNTVRVNCWHCNQDVRITASLKHSWRCPICEQYNGFTESGDYNASKEVIYGAISTRKHHVERSLETRSDAGILCATCEHNQTQWMIRRAKFEASSDETFDEEAKELDTSAPLCNTCAVKVKKEIERADRYVAQINLFSVIKRSQSTKIAINSDGISVFEAIGAVIEFLWWPVWSCAAMGLILPHLLQWSQNRIVLMLFHLILRLPHCELYYILLGLEIISFLIALIRVCGIQRDHYAAAILAIVMLRGTAIVFAYMDKFVLIEAVLHHLGKSLMYKDAIEPIIHQAAPVKPTNPVIESPMIHSSLNGLNIGSSVSYDPSSNPFSNRIQLVDGKVEETKHEMDVDRLIRDMSIKQSRASVLWESLVTFVQFRAIPVLVHVGKIVLEWSCNYSLAARSNITREAWMWGTVGVTAVLRLISDGPFLLRIHVGALGILVFHYTALTISDTSPRQGAFLSHRSNLVRDVIVALMLSVLLWRGISEIASPQPERLIYVRGEQVVWQPSAGIATPIPSTTPIPPVIDSPSSWSEEWVGKEAAALLSALALTLMNVRNLL